MSLSDEDLDLLFPFRVCADRSLIASRVGPSLHRVLPELCPGARVTDHLRAFRPAVALSWDSTSNPETLWVLEAPRTGIRLKGQILHVTGHVHFFLSPWVPRLSDLDALGLQLNDFALHDGTVDYLMALRLTTASLQDLQVVQQATAEKQQALEAAHRDLQETLGQLVLAGKLAALGELASGVAHEINNPLTAVMSSVELLQHGLDTMGAPPTLKRHAERIVVATERCADIVKQLLSFAQEESLTRMTVDVAVVVGQSTALVGRQIEGQGTTLAADVEAGLFVLASASALQQVVLHLVMNAAHALGHGGHIAVCGRRDGDQVLLSVSDDGPGVPADIRDRIFDPFFTTEPTGRGKGLGLSVCHGIVRASGGQMRVEEADTGGARFVVTLPSAV